VAGRCRTAPIAPHSGPPSRPPDARHSSAIVLSCSPAWCHAMVAGRARAMGRRLPALSRSIDARAMRTVRARAAALHEPKAPLHHHATPVTTNTQRVGGAKRVDRATVDASHASRTPARVDATVRRRRASNAFLCAPAATAAAIRHDVPTIVLELRSGYREGACSTYSWPSAPRHHFRSARADLEAIPA
jgi:hypothetical protein